MAPKSDKSATPSRSTPTPSGVPGASYKDEDARVTVLGKSSPEWDNKRIKEEVRTVTAALAAAAVTKDSVDQHTAQLESLSSLHGELANRTGQAENKVEQLESGLAEQGTRQDARFTQEERCMRAHAQQIDAQHVALANQLSHKQLEKLATKEDLQQLFQQQLSKRARSATASPPAPSSDTEEEPTAAKEPPTYEELQAELEALKANKASTSKATSDKAKTKQWGKKVKHADNNKGGRAPEGSVEEARRQAEYHRRKAQEADALLAERKK